MWAHFRPAHSSWDLIADYRKAPKSGWSAGRTGKNSPHVWFANADTDEKLMAFVKRYGPIAARTLRERHDESPLTLDRELDPPTIVAEQDMAELRSERTLYHAALTLLAELRREETADISVVRECVARIANGTLDWPRQWIREERLRTSNSEPKPNWDFGEEAVRVIETCEFYALREPPDDALTAVLSAVDPIRAGHNILCELVNAFQPRVYVWGQSPIEGPHWDVRYGIRPLLYHILRQQYLGGGGIAICANVQCREVFEVERAGERFCSPTCSQHQRQRQYWVDRGKKQREKRRKQKKTAGKRATKKG